MKIESGCRMEGKMDRKGVAAFSLQSDKDKLHYLELGEMSRDFTKCQWRNFSDTIKKWLSFLCLGYFATP